MSSGEKDGGPFAPFRRLASIYYLLAGFDVLTVCMALFLNHLVTNSFEDGVRTSAAWSRRQAEIIQLSRLAQEVDAPGNDVFFSRDVSLEREMFEAALRRFNEELVRVSKDIEDAPLSFHNDGLLHRLASAQEAMNQMAAQSDLVFREFERGSDERASRGMAVMDRTFATLGQRLDDAVALVESGRAEHLNEQLANARAMRQLEFILAAAVLVIVVLVAAYGSHMGRMLRANERQRNNMLKDVGEARDRLRHYADDVSHELRGPISKLRLDAEVLASQPRSPEQYRDGIEAMLIECERISSIVESLLFLARSENAPGTLKTQALDAGRELELLVEFFAAAAENAGVELLLQVDSIPVQADRHLFQRAVSNLISNALDHTPKGGCVTLKASAVSEGTAIDILDTGAGIPDAIRKRVFDRFFRGASGRGVQGLGLGLAITKGIMDMHRGVICLAPGRGGGTHARLIFPRPSVQ